MTTSFMQTMDNKSSITFHQSLFLGCSLRFCRRGTSTVAFNPACRRRFRHPEIINCPPLRQSISYYKQNCLQLERRNASTLASRTSFSTFVTGQGRAQSALGFGATEAFCFMAVLLVQRHQLDSYMTCRVCRESLQKLHRVGLGNYSTDLLC